MHREGGSTTGTRQVLLELICYASNRGKPAILNLRPEYIEELSTRGLIEEHDDGYWITDLGRAQCPKESSPGREIHSPMDVPAISLVQGRSANDGAVTEERPAAVRAKAC
jgi:hypothetical protein